jgi:hypothetical protein
MCCSARYLRRQAAVHSHPEMVDAASSPLPQPHRPSSSPHQHTHHHHPKSPSPSATSSSAVSSSFLAPPTLPAAEAIIRAQPAPSLLGAGLLDASAPRPVARTPLGVLNATQTKSLFGGAAKGKSESGTQSQSQSQSQTAAEAEDSSSSESDSSSSAGDEQKKESNSRAITVRSSFHLFCWIRFVFV